MLVCLVLKCLSQSLILSQKDLSIAFTNTSIRTQENTAAFIVFHQHIIIPRRHLTDAFDHTNLLLILTDMFALQFPPIWCHFLTSCMINNDYLFLKGFTKNLQNWKWWCSIKTIFLTFLLKKEKKMKKHLEVVFFPVFNFSIKL